MINKNIQDLRRRSLNSLKNEIVSTSAASGLFSASLIMFLVILPYHTSLFAHMPVWQ